MTIDSSLPKTIGRHGVTAYPGGRGNINGEQELVIV